MMTNNKYANERNHRVNEEWLPSVGEDDREDRIDWDRKQRGKKTHDLDDLLLEEVDPDVILEQPEQKKRQKKITRNKRRHLVYDEEHNRIIVKRKRKRSRAEYEDYDYDF